MTTLYPKTVAAALAETRSLIVLADSLALEVPEREPGENTANDPVTGRRYGTGRTVFERLEEVSADIVAAGGELRPVSTLDSYRKTANWVAKHEGWVSGQSYSAHRHAYESGVSYEEFAANPSAYGRNKPVDDSNTLTAALAALEGMSRQDVVAFLQYVARYFPDLMAESAEDFSDDLIVDLTAMRVDWEEKKRTAGSSGKIKLTREEVMQRILSFSPSAAVRFAVNGSDKLGLKAEEVRWDVSHRQWAPADITSSDTNEIEANLAAAEAQIEIARESLRAMQARNNPSRTR